MLNSAVAPIAVNQDTFADVIENAQGLALVDFWAPWCGPCRMIAPIVDEIAEAYQGQVVVAKVNVDETPEIASRFGIRSIPTLVYFKNGKPVDQVVGAVLRPTIENKLRQLMS